MRQGAGFLFLQLIHDRAGDEERDVAGRPLQFEHLDPIHAHRAREDAQQHGRGEVHRLERQAVGRVVAQFMQAVEAADGIDEIPAAADQDVQGPGRV